MTSLPRFLFAAAAFVGAMVLAGQPEAFAQVTPSPSASDGGARPSFSDAELENLVGPIALYPDDLVAIILPASTFPLQIVQAARFFDKRKANPQLQPDTAWDDSVKSLLNYPDVVKKMSDDLDWTQDLGEAVVANSSAVLDAVQAFRRRAETAGNLKSDPKQTVVVEKEIIKIVPANPQIIYVPQYQPTAVVVAGAPIAYYPTPYPVYYYPYPPGAAIAAGVIWGAAIGAAWNGGHWNTHYHGSGYYGGGSINNSNNITVNRGGNTINTGNINTGNINRATTLPANTSAWKPTQQPGQVGRPTSATTSRIGDARPGTSGGYGAQGATRPSTQPAVRPGAGGQQNFAAGGNQGGARGQAGGGGGAFSGYGSGGAAQQASARGQSSRASAGNFGGGAQGGRQMGAAPSGGRAAAGGGAPAGGGARAGGGRRR
jgi:hypothetical protein